MQDHLINKTKNKNDETIYKTVIYIVQLKYQ